MAPRRGLRKDQGQMHSLWRTIDHEGEVPESFATKERDKAAALKFIKKLMKRHGRVEATATDGLRPYAASMKEIGAAGRQEVGRWANNRAENSHLPFRRRERAMLRFRRMKTLEKLASVHAQAHNHFTLGRHLVSGESYKERRSTGAGREALGHGRRPGRIGPCRGGTETGCR
jgi:putative transposase